MSNLEFHLFPCRKDNYGYLVHDPKTGATASIDAPDAKAVEAALSEKGWTLTDIFITHHHQDHTDGIAALKSASTCHVVGPTAEAERIAGLDQTVGEGDPLTFAGHEIAVLATPGHTLGHISYWFKDAGAAFVGDTLFALGCGRVFEGDNAMMWASLQKLMQLPPATEIYCGHEYTAANAAFALTIEPNNKALIARAKNIMALREADQPTVPSTLGEELETNPFLRPDSPDIRQNLNMAAASDGAVFAEIRERKNRA